VCVVDRFKLNTDKPEKNKPEKTQYSQERKGADEWINRQDERIMHGYEYLIFLRDFFKGI
jgi:hypothetical protein